MSFAADRHHDEGSSWLDGASTRRICGVADMSRSVVFAPLRAVLDLEPAPNAPSSAGRRASDRNRPQGRWCARRDRIAEEHDLSDAFDRLVVRSGAIGVITGENWS